MLEFSVTFAEINGKWVLVKIDDNREITQNDVECEVVTA